MAQETPVFGEGVRMLLAYAGTRYAAHGSPAGHGLCSQTEQILDGKPFVSSSAIYRYLGRKFGLCGDSLEDELEINQNVDFFADLLFEAAAIFLEPDEQIKAKKQADAETNEYPQMLAKLDEIVGKNDGHIALGKLTWGDFFVAELYDGLRYILQMPDLHEKYPNLEKIYLPMKMAKTAREALK